VLRIAPILPEFLELYPDVSIDLHLDDAHVDLVGEGYDAAVRITSALPDSSLIARTLAPVSRYLVAAPNYLAKHGRPPHPLRLADHRCIAYVATPGGSWHFSNAKGETATVRPQGPFRVNNGDALLPALIAGVGLGILPEFIVSPALADGRLEIVLPEWSTSGGGVHWLTPPGGRRPPQTRGRARRLPAAQAVNEGAVGHAMMLARFVAAAWCLFPTLIAGVPERRLRTPRRQVQFPKGG
jgi:DNA-binding transcriptional LysR family regulator